MFFFLASLSLCFNFGPYVKDLTASNFASEVDNRSNTTVYFVMFHGQHCPACQMAYPEFTEAANEAAGMIKFGHVDTNSEYVLGQRFRIYAIPHFIIFYNGGERVYQRERIARSFLNAASRYIPNLSETVNESWVELLPEQNATDAKSAEEPLKAAILFSNKPSTPPIWSGVSCEFENNTKGIRIGFCNDPNVSAKFDVNAFPTILLINGTNRYIYNGKNRFQLIRKSIIDFFEGVIDVSQNSANNNNKKVKTPAVLIHNLTSLETFNSECKGKGKFCVIQGGGNEKASPDFEKASQKYKHDHFMFFVCPTEKCPFDFVSAKPSSEESSPKVWIFHHKRDAAIVVDDINTLNSTLDRVVDGGARFTPVEKLKEQNNSEL